MLILADAMLIRVDIISAVVAVNPFLISKDCVLLGTILFIERKSEHSFKVHRVRIEEDTNYVPVLRVTCRLGKVNAI